MNPTGLICDIPASNYKTCIPLSAKLDNDCIPTTTCARCQPDCMGTGYGYCTTPPPPTIPVTPAPITLSPITAAPITSAPITAAPITTKAAITPSPITVNLCPGCRNPITGQCDFHAPCFPANYCQRPLEFALGPTGHGQVLAPAVCDAFPDAQCRVTSCGGCTEYFEDAAGNIYTQQQCGIVPASSPVEQTLPSVCDVTLCEAPQCNGCKALSVQSKIIPCPSDPCCGCGATFSIHERDVTAQCEGPGDYLSSPSDSNCSSSFVEI